MAVLVEQFMRTTTIDATGLVSNIEPPALRFGLGVGTIAPIDTELVCPAGVFTAAVVPTGARAVRIQVGAAPNLTLKAQTGDAAGIAITPGSNPLGADLFLTLASGAVFGFLNGGASSATLRLVFF